MVDDELEPLVGRDPNQPKRTKTMGVRITPEFFAEITHAAHRRGMTRADALRRWVKDGMERDNDTEAPQ